MIHVHMLLGCAPAPLAHYLKALGVLRLVSEQADPGARGFWRDSCFGLATSLDRGALEAFFLETYAPTPITAPWNKGAGFFSKEDKGLSPLESSTAQRFAPFRAGAAAARALVTEIAAADAAVRAIKDESKKLAKAQKERLRKDPDYKRRLAEAERNYSRLKAGLIPRCHVSWSGAQRQWMDAAVVLGADKPVYPSLLGTGGNDGRLDFTNNYYQRLQELFDAGSGRPSSQAAAQLRAALWATPERALVSGATGQFLPGSAGGANTTNGPSGDSAINPFDFVLALEGTALFTARATRRLETEADLLAAAPFQLRSGAAGYASASASDEGPRGEQWMPLWPRAASLAEVQHLLGEGRAQIEGKAAREPLDLARAITRLGVARGVSSFERYGYIERNGQSNLAVPLGTFRVPDAPPRALALLDDLEAWLLRLRRRARDDHAPARLRLAERRLSEALLAVVQHPDEPARWQAVLLRLGEVEAVLTTGAGFEAGPIPPLDAGWLAAADDGSPELRLAAAFALQGAPGPKGAWDGIRRHVQPMDGRRFATSDRRLAHKSDVVLTGRSAVADAGALLLRRLVEATQSGKRHLPLFATSGTAARVKDLAAVIAGAVDAERVLKLARALMAVERGPLRGGLRPTVHVAQAVPDDAWIVVRLATLPFPLRHGVHPGTDPAIVRRLVSGDPQAAFEVALRRLSAAGVRPGFTRCAVDAERGRLWALALAFPISPAEAQALLRRIEPTKKGLDS